jgi:hypothetical protein
MLAFIPRKWRLTRWQALLGAAATIAWWAFVGDDFVHEPNPDVAWYLFGASWAIPAWLLYWAIIVATRWVSARRPVVVRALVEIAAFAAMIGVAMLVTYLFPERHFWHGEVSREFNYSPLVFAATLISEVGMYISWRVLGAVTQASKPGPCLGSISIPPAQVIGLPREDKPASESPAGEPPADVQEEESPNLPAPDPSSRPLDQTELITPWARHRLPSMGTMVFIAVVLLIGGYLFVGFGMPVVIFPAAVAGLWIVIRILAEMRMFFYKWICLFNIAINFGQFTFMWFVVSTTTRFRGHLFCFLWAWSAFPGLYRKDTWQ